MQVLAVTGNASLVVALGSMMRDWEVVTVRSAEEAIAQGTSSMIALIDMGETNEGIEIADEMFRHGLSIPGVVIGDVPAEHPRVAVLVRPFSLEDLSLAVRDASQRPMASAVPEPEPVVEAPSQPPASPVEPREETHAPPREPAMTQTEAKPAAASAAQAAAATAPARHPAPERPAPPPTPKVEPAPRPLSVVRPPKEEEAAPPVVGEPEEPVAAEPAPEPEPPAYEEPAPEEPVEDTPAAIAEPVYEEPVYTPPERVQAPPVQAPVPPGAPVAASAARAPEPVESRRRGLRRRPAKPMRPAATVAAPDEPPLVKHLKAAARNLRDIESLLAELPFLEDLRSMADALVGEVEAQFDPQTAAVFVPAEDGFQPIAHRGLSRVEAGMVVPHTQPLFSDVISTRDGILIQPVDLAQGLVAGIGGARTEAMMAAPAVLDGEVVAVVVIGSERFDETDLDRLSDIAAEAAPGLGVALRIQELRARGGSI